MATAHELSSRKNEARIDAAIAQFDAGKGTERTLIEP
jgi:hypothetical protein